MVLLTETFAASTLQKPSATPLTGEEVLRLVQDGTSVKLTVDTLAAYVAGDFQEADDDLTALAALTPDDGSFIVGDGATWVAESGATARASLGLTIGTHVQAWDAQLDSLSAASANGVSLVTAADYAAMRALLDLEAGADFLSPAAIAAAYQPLDSDLTAIAALTTTAYGRSLLTLADEDALEALLDTLPNLGSIQGVSFTFGAYAATLLNNANESAFKAAVNLEIGVDVQAYDADLASWAGVTRASGFDTFAATPSLANLGSLLTDEASGLITFMTTPSSANLRSLLTDESGTGAALFQDGALGTPASGTLTNCTGLPTAGLVDDAVTFAKMQNITSDRLLGRDTASSGNTEEISLNATLEFTGSTSIQRAALTGAIAASAGSNSTTMTGGLVFIIDGGGSTITTGIKGDVRIPFACTITGWTLLADQSGAIVVDVWRDTLANFPPTDADSITNGSEPEIAASGTNAEDTNLGDWTDTTMDAGDILRFNVDSVTSHTRVSLILHITKTG